MGVCEVKRQPQSASAASRSAAQVLGALKSVFAQRNVVGFDVVELMPTENKAPDFLAAKLVYKLLSYKFAP